MRTEDRQSDPALKAIDILEALTDVGESGIGITEVAEKAGLNKSTAHRIMLALAKRNYVIRNEDTKRYKLGLKILQLGGAVLDHLNVKELASPYLIELSRQTGETVHLVQLDGNQGVYIDKVDSPHSFGLLSYIGKRIMLHCTAAGKALLAYTDQAKREGMLAETGLPARTANTITDRERLAGELADIRGRGYAWNRCEDRIDVNGIAAPLFDDRRNVVCAVAVAGPSDRFTEELAAQAVPILLETAQAISAKLGHAADGK